jgi:RNA polymerase sigma-B factor
MQVASFGLVKAIDRFDPTRGTSFSTYAVPTIVGELKRYFRDSGWAVHVPRGMQERVMKLDTAVQHLQRVLGRSPSTKELAVRLGASEEEVLEVLQASLAYNAQSLDAPRSDDGHGVPSGFLETLGEDEAGYELVEYGSTISETLKTLDSRDRLILHLRFVADMTQAEIADRLGISQMHVSRLLRRMLSKLRSAAGDRAAA